MIPAPFSSGVMFGAGVLTACAVARVLSGLWLSHRDSARLRDEAPRMKSSAVCVDCGTNYAGVVSGGDSPCAVCGGPLVTAR